MSGTEDVAAARQVFLELCPHMAREFPDLPVERSLTMTAYMQGLKEGRRTGRLTAPVMLDMINELKKERSQMRTEIEELRSKLVAHD